MSDPYEPDDNAWVLMKHQELHGDNPDVPPSRVPYSAFRDLWGPEKGFELCDEQGQRVTNPADALADPVHRAAVAAAKAPRKAADKASATTKEA